MRRLRFALGVVMFILLFSGVVFGKTGDGAYIVESLEMNIHGVSWPFEVLEVMDELEYTTELGCRLDTGAVDIVWALDTSGSMGGELTGMRSAITGFVGELNARGYDYRLGTVKYGDRPVRVKDFNTSLPGFQMTSNAAEFIAHINGTGVSGGGDGPELQIDAIAHAITDYDWRPDAMHVIITYTDAPYHERGDGSGFSDYLDTEVYDLVLSTGTVVFFASSSYDATADVFYEMIAEDSGGSWYPLSTSFTVILDDVIELLTTWEAINAQIVNNSGVTCAVNVLLIPNEPTCVEVLSSNPLTSPVTPPGGTIDIGFHVEVDSLCSGSDRCFSMVLSGCAGEVDTLVGCTTDDSCRCVGPDAEVIFPLLPSGDCGVLTACELQHVMFNIHDDDSPVDPTSIVVVVDGTTYYYPDHMTFIGGQLTWTPTVPWTHGQTVTFSLTSATDIEGCPMFGRPTCNFYVDLEPPANYGILPECGILLEDTVFYGEYIIGDDIAGIDVANTYFTVNGTPFYMGSPYVDFTGSTMSGNFTLNGTFRQLGFYAADSVVICLHPADLVPNTPTQPFCGPNDTTYCCTYYLNNAPDAYFTHPAFGSITGCDPDSIVFVVTDPDGEIDPDGVILSVDGFYATVPGGFLTYRDDTVFVFHPPAGYWASGDTVHCEIVAAYDIWGASVPDLPIYWEFIVDTEPPLITYHSPSYGVELLAMPDSGYISLFDIVSGVDTSGLIVVVNGEEMEWRGEWTDSPGYDSVMAISFPLSMDLCMGAGETCMVEICVENIHDQPDYCDPNDTTFCWYFTILRSGPTPVIIFPPHESYIACNDSTITMEIPATLAPVEPTSIRFIVNEDTFTTADSELSFVDSLYLIFRPGASYWLDDTVYYVTLDSVADIYGTPAPSSMMPIEWRFFTDFSAPAFWGTFPIEDATVAVESPTISVHVFDSITGLDTTSLEFTIGDSMTFGLDNPCVDYDTITHIFELRTECLGIMFEDYDTVNVCASAFDTPDHCDPNIGEYCWSFVVSLSPPEPGIVTYIPSSWVACDSTDQAVLMTIVDPDGIDISTLEIMVEDSMYYWGDPELEWDGDSMLTFRPVDPWEYFGDAEEIDICITRVADLLGNVMSDPLCWSFHMDLSNPIIWNPWPRPDTILNDSLAIIEVSVWDSLTGIDTSTIYMIIDGVTYNLEDPCLSWDGDSILTYDISCAGSSWVDWDTVQIVVGACDSPDTCAPNCDEWGWQFYVHLTGPTAELISPLPGQITSCRDQCIEMLLWDDWEGVDDTTIAVVINEIDTFDISSSMLTYTEEESLLVFCPDSIEWRYWANEETIQVELVQAYDTLGNPLGTPISWSFVADLEPPVPSGILPIPGDIITMLYPVVELDLTDNLAGVAPDSIVLNVHGVDYTIDSPELAWDGTHITWTSDMMFYGGDSVRACIYTMDNPDLCTGNDTTYCWVFYIEAGGPSPAVVRPLNGTISSCLNQDVVFTMTDDNGIIDTSLHFYVVRSSDLSDTVFLDTSVPEVDYDYAPMPLHQATITYLPTIPFEDPETVFVCITACMDSVFNPMSPSPYCWEFYMDQTPPEVTGMTPAPGSIVPVRSPLIEFDIWDEIAGLDVDGVVISVNSHSFGLDDPCVTFDELTGHVEVDLDCADVEFFGGDTVNVMIPSNDTVDYCENNFDAPEWFFVIEPGGPSAEIERPMPEAIVSCAAEYIAIGLADPTGIDTMTIVMVVDGDTIRWSDAGETRLSYDEGLEMLYFVPDPAFDDLDEIHVELIEAYDFLMNPLEDTLIWDFSVDRVPPVIWGTSPTVETTSPRPFIDFNISDETSGVNFDSLIVTISSTSTPTVSYRISDAALTRLGDTLVRFDPSVEGIRWSGGDTVCVTVEAFDSAHAHYGLPDWEGEDCPPNYSDTSWCFVITPGGPMGQILYPFAGAWDACVDSISMRLEDEDGVVDTSIVVWIERPDLATPIDEHIGTSDPNITYDGTEYLTYIPVTHPPFEDGETVTISIVEAYDVLFNELEECDTLIYYYDYTPPVLNSYTPAAWTSIDDDITPDICMDIEDVLSGIDESSIVLTVDGVDYGIGAPGMNWDGDELCFVPEDAGVRWYGGDTICVTIYAEDSPDLCDPHPFDSTWCFTIAPGGPVPTIDRPEPNAWSACTDEYIAMTIEDPQGILDSTITLEITRYAGTSSEVTTAFTTSDAELSFTYPELEFVPDPAFANGESIYVCLTEVEDNLSNPLAAPLCWAFNMDLQAPVYWNEQPAAGTELLVRTNPITVQLYDSLTGINPTSIELRLQNATAGTPPVVLHNGDTGLTYDETSMTLSIDPASLGVVWTGGDSLCVTVSSYDTPSDTSGGFALDYCDPNESSFAWCFTVAPGGPVASIVRPLDSTYSSCIDEHLEISLSDADVGVDVNTIVLRINGNVYTWPDAQLSYDEDAEMLYFHPDPAFEDGITYRVELVEVADLLGNVSTNLLSWSFTMDMTAPDFSVTAPPLPEAPAVYVTRNKNEPISIQVHDGVSGIDEDEVVFTLILSDTLEFDVSELGWSYNEETGLGSFTFVPDDHGIRFSEGDSVRFAIRANDVIDYCDDNFSSDSFMFLIEPEFNCFRGPNPFTPNGDSYNDITLFEYPYMTSEDATLRIFNKRRELVYERDIEVTNITNFSERDWDGTDTQGNRVRPGLYIYLIIKDGEVICEGTVTLVR